MNILFIGGTAFVGRTMVEQALERGHTLTLFNRGQRNPGVFPEVEHIQGNRDGDLDLLRGKQWDAVIDTCGYVPRIVNASATLLANAVERYVFVSSISVYGDFSQLGVDETATVGTIDDETIEEVTGDSYGPLKALCEQAVEQAMPGRSLIIRPGLIVGPYDPTDRFTYWPWRIAQGGNILAPAVPHMHSQIIDVRDLAAWTLDMVEAQQVGVFNATGPAQPLEFGQILASCVDVSGSNAQFTWAEEAWLLAQGVNPWIELPLWLPTQSDATLTGFGDVSIERAVAAGLRFRPLETTIRDTLAWANTRPADYQWRAGLSAEREAELLMQRKEAAARQ